MDKHMDNIIDNIYVGDIFSLANTYSKNNFSKIISLVPNPMKEMLSSNNIEIIEILFEDNENVDIIKYCKIIYPLLINKKENENILVHCMSGKSRSASVVIYYIMKKFGKTYEDSYNYVKNKRKCIEPNRGFIKQLQNIKL